MCVAFAFASVYVIDGVRGVVFTRYIYIYIYIVFFVFCVWWCCHAVVIGVGVAPA